MNRPHLLPPLRQQVNERAMSRFGLEVGKLVRQTLIRRVCKGDVKYARKVTNSRTVIVLEYAGMELAFIYSNASKEIISFLGPNAPETADWRHSQSAVLTLIRPGPLRPEGTRR
jgi:hypothetical protein